MPWRHFGRRPPRPERCGQLARLGPRVVAGLERTPAARAVGVQLAPRLSRPDDTGPISQWSRRSCRLAVHESKNCDNKKLRQQKLPEEEPKQARERMGIGP